MSRNGFYCVLLCLALIFAVISVTVASSEENDDSSFGDIFRSLGSSIQEGAKKVGESVQKGYEFVKNKVKSIGEETSESPTTVLEVRADSSSVLNLEQSVDNNSTTDMKQSADPTPAPTPASGKIETSTADVENRFLFDAPVKCPAGQLIDHTGNCRRV